MGPMIDPWGTSEYTGVKDDFRQPNEVIFYIGAPLKLGTGTMKELLFFYFHSNLIFNSPKAFGEF